MIDTRFATLTINKTNTSFSRIGTDGAFSKPAKWQKSYPLSTAREWDSEASIYHYRARQYNQYAGKFTARDPIGYDGGINLYTYVNSNPVNYFDPTGLRMPIWLPGLIHKILEEEQCKHMALQPGQPLVVPSSQICGPDVTDWFFNEVTNHFKWADKQRQSLKGYSGFAQRVAAYTFFASYAKSIPHKHMSFSAGDCPTNCPNTVTLCNACIEKSEMGGLIFGISGRAYGFSWSELWVGAKVLGFFKKPEDIASTAVGHDMISDTEFSTHLSSAEKMCAYMTGHKKWEDVKKPYVACEICPTPLPSDYPHTTPGYPCK